MPILGSNVQPMHNTTHARVVLPSGHHTYRPVYLPVRANSNPKHVAVTAPTLGANRHFRGGKRA